MPTELRKALTSTGDGDALNIDDLDRVLHEELLRLQPLTELLAVRQSEGKTHEYRLKTSHPMAWFEGELTGANNKNGVYERKQLQIKIQRIWGEVSGFSRTVTRAFIDNLATEIEGSLQGMADLYEFGSLYGASNDITFTGDALQYSGILPRVMKYAPVNVVDAGGDKVTLTDLDALLAKARKHRQTRRDPYLWMMGQEMKQVVDGLQSKVSIPLTSTVLADGKIEMAAYNGFGIFETDMLTPEASTSSPTVAGSIGAGGALADGTYTYKIASVTAFGEQVAGTASGNIVAATTNKTANLTWTADPLALNYMIFRNVAAGTFYLIDIIPALTYDGDGKVNGAVASYADAGARAPITQVKPLAAGEEQIVLFNMNPDRSHAFYGMVDDMGEQIGSLVSFVELARTKDSYPYMLKSYSSLRTVFPNLSAVLRHVKKA